MPCQSRCDKSFDFGGELKPDAALACAEGTQRLPRTFSRVHPTPSAANCSRSAGLFCSCADSGSNMAAAVNRRVSKNGSLKSFAIMLRNQVYFALKPVL